MPIFDFPLSQLAQYRGTNPKPADFDAYWAASLSEMADMDSQVSLIPAEFQSPVADCYHLYFTGVGGARIHAKYLRPKGVRERCPAILMFHGYKLHSGNWNDKLPYVASGFHVVAMDCRGQGGLSEDPGGARGTTMGGHIIRGLSDAPEKLLYRSIFLDTAQLARVMMSLEGVDSSRVGVTGASQGGALALACAALEPRIRCAAPVYPFLCDYQRVWEMDLAKEAYQELRDYFRWLDPQHQHEKETFTRLGYIDVVHLAPRIRGRCCWPQG